MLDKLMVRLETVDPRELTVRDLAVWMGEAAKALRLVLGGAEQTVALVGDPDRPIRHELVPRTPDAVEAAHAFIERLEASRRTVELHAAPELPPETAS
jgi:hypothetical protein